MPINAQVLLSVLSHESTSGDISQTLRVTPATYALSLGDGTGANQAQVAWSDSRTFPAGGEDSFAIRSLTDDRGTVSPAGSVWPARLPSKIVNRSPDRSACRVRPERTSAASG